MELKYRRCTVVMVYTHVVLLLLLNVPVVAKMGTYRFSLSVPREHLGDTLPSPIPKKNKFNMLSYGVDAAVRLPVHTALDFSEVHCSGDVNAMDALLPSSWYTPRFGYADVSPEQLVEGPLTVGPPQHPITVVKAKSGGNNPGFIIQDGRGYRYLIKFDPPQYPHVETTTALIVNRLFWGFGYNVPEDYLFSFREEELSVDTSGALALQDVQKVLFQVAAPENGYYVSTASRFIQGKILGGTLDRGINKSDRNDWIPHENRRILRAMKVFGAFTNHVGMRPDNSLDVYVGEPNLGYVKHYLLDFGEALGGHGAGRQVLWNGFEHLFSFKEMFANFITLGFRVKPWEGTDFTPWKSVGPIEAEAFDPATWREITQYQPMRMSLPDDDYWAAKVIGALKKDHLEKLVAAAAYPEPAASEYILTVLLKRRQKVLDHFLYQVTPVENGGLVNNNLVLHDMGRVLKATDAKEYVPVVQLYTATYDPIGPSRKPLMSKNALTVSIGSQTMESASGYIIVAIHMVRDGYLDTPPAQFHVCQIEGGSYRLLGVVH